jgi:hypothetical protein
LLRKGKDAGGKIALARQAAVLLMRFPRRSHTRFVPKKARR